MCGIIGLISNKTDVPLKLYEGLTFLQHRGQDSAGICNETLCIKDHGLVKDVFKESDLDSLRSNIGIGHVRYGTTGNFDDSCVQPLYNNENKRVSLCHNGNIINTDEIKNFIQKDHINSDSECLLYLFCHIMNEYGWENISYTNIFETCQQIMKIVKGSYSVILLIKDFGMICFRDIFGIRPLCYGSKQNDFLIASESVAVDALEYQFIRDVHPGEIIVFQHNEMPRFCQYSESQLYPCLFEYIYFSRIDSIIDNISIYDARFKMGQLLGEKIKSMEITDIDLIVPVPDSSLIFALGVQDVLNIKTCNGFVKNNYIERTFIMKHDKIIQKSIKRKINAVKSVIQNKNILVVDDSIVRGNTSSHIVYLAKRAGTKKIYFGSGAPPILYHNQYGIFIPDRNDLIAVNRTPQNIADILGCTKVIYNELPQIINCLKSINPKIDGFETSMLDNNHLFLK